MNTKVCTMPIDCLTTAEPFSSIFPIDPAIIEKITVRMKKDGFDLNHPISVWKTDKTIVLDGHTRLHVARSLGITAVPVFLNEFKDEAEALDYAIAQQVERRNMTVEEMMHYIQVADKLSKRGPKKKTQDCAKPDDASKAMEGKSAVHLAKTLHIPVRRAECLRRVAKEGSEETKQALCKGTISLSQAYQDTLAQKTLNKEREKVNMEDSPKTTEKTNVTDYAVDEDYCPPDKKLQRLKELRFDMFPDNVLDSIKDTVAGELKNYSSVRYSSLEMASIKKVILNGLDGILSVLVNDSAVATTINGQPQE